MLNVKFDIIALYYLFSGHAIFILCASRICQYQDIFRFSHIRDALPKASFIGFTGTPVESGDKNTQAVFGEPRQFRSV
ncbi:MAG: hypothetical protein ABSF60_12315 [Verrucomicrobiota bacterium]